MKTWITLTTPLDGGKFYIRASSICMVSAPSPEMLDVHPTANAQIALALLTCGVGTLETVEKVMQELTGIDANGEPVI
jgi:hypothetical protein